MMRMIIVWKTLHVEDIGKNALPVLEKGNNHKKIKKNANATEYFAKCYRYKFGLKKETPLRNQHISE
jgi:hypothetical protein